jgi:hypothetical protein
MANSEKQSKATKFLASYSCWDYKFNKKIREKFKSISKNFLTNDNLVDYDFVMKATNKAKKIHYIYLTSMFLIGTKILDSIFDILNFNTLSLEQIIYGNYVTPSESESIILIIFFLSFIITFIYDFIIYKNIASILNND